MKPIYPAAFILAFAVAPFVPSVAAQYGHDAHQMGQGMAQGQHMQMAWTDGTVKRVNADVGKVTVAHGPLPKLDMPPMTMVFRVKDPAWIGQMKPGDRIRFVADRVNGALTITELEARQ